MTQERIVQLLEEIRDLQTSQKELIAQMQKQSIQTAEKSDVYMEQLIEQRKNESRSVRLRSSIMIAITILAVSLFLIVIAYKSVGK